MNINDDTDRVRKRDSRASWSRNLHSVTSFTTSALQVRLAAKKAGVMRNFRNVSLRVVKRKWIK